MEKLGQIEALNEATLGTAEKSKYDRYLDPVKQEIHQLRTILEAAQAKVLQSILISSLLYYLFDIDRTKSERG